MITTIIAAQRFAADTHGFASFALLFSRFFLRSYFAVRFASIYNDSCSLLSYFFCSPGTSVVAWENGIPGIMCFWSFLG
jgi:hypothetical protein